MAREFSDFDAWMKACEELNYVGPSPIQGRGNFEFVDENAQRAALWNGTTATGVIEADAPAEPAHEESIHE